MSCRIVTEGELNSRLGVLKETQCRNVTPHLHGCDKSLRTVSLVAAKPKFLSDVSMWLLVAGNCSSGTGWTYCSIATNRRCSCRSQVPVLWGWWSNNSSSSNLVLNIKVSIQIPFDPVVVTIMPLLLQALYSLRILYFLTFQAKVFFVEMHWMGFDFGTVSWCCCCELADWKFAC